MADTFDVCGCCASVMVNGDDSSCRDYYGHDHAACQLGPDWVLVSDSGPTSHSYGWTCAGCGTDQLPYGEAWPVLELR